MNKRKITDITIGLIFALICMINLIFTIMYIFAEMTEDMRFSCQEGGLIQQAGCIIRTQRPEIRALTRVPTIILTIIVVGIIYFNKRKTHKDTH